MHRIDGAGATVDNKFTQGNPVTGVPATTVTDAWLNDVQEELVSVVSSAGILLEKGSLQLLPALGKLSGRVVDSIAALKALDKTKISRACTWGYYAAGDGGGAEYWMDAADTTSADNGFTVLVAGDGGRWKLVLTWWSVNVKVAGARGDGIANDAPAIQVAATYAASNHLELWFPDGGYKVTSKITIDGDATGFKSVRWRGTFQSTGTVAGYAPGQSGSTIITSGNAALEVWFRRFFNENVAIRGIAFVDVASVYPGAITAAAAIKLIKGDPVGFPAEKRYITGNIFEDVAVYGYAEAVLFRGSYRKDQGGAYTDNYFGPTNFVRFYPYQCGAGIVAENATLNRLRVSESLFFSLNSGGIVKREAADLPVGGRTEMMVMCQLDMVHFEDVRGIFRFSGAPPAGEIPNYVTMVDVTRELCGLFTQTTGNPYGVIEYTTITTLGRHDSWGETTLPALGVGSSITSQHGWSGGVIGVGFSASPDRVNVLTQTFNLVSGGANLIKGLVLAEGLGYEFDITTVVRINGGAGGVKTFHSYGVTQAGAGGRFHDAEGQLAGGFTAGVSTASGAIMQEFVVSNTSGAAAEVEITVLRNETGVQCYLA